jgi:hypothetical protein
VCIVASHQKFRELGDDLCAFLEKQERCLDDAVYLGECGFRAGLAALHEEDGEVSSLQYLKNVCASISVLFYIVLELVFIYYFQSHPAIYNFI